jgi:hypothetical protein
MVAPNAFNLDTSGLLRAFESSAVVTLIGDPTGVQLFRFGNTFSTAASVTRALGTHVALQVNPTYTPGSSATFTGLTERAIFSNPTLSNAGTGNTATAIYGLVQSGAVNTNWTVTDWGGLLVNDPAGSGGTITNLYGVNVQALTSRSSTIVAAYHSEVAAASGKFFLHDTGGAQSSLAGKVTRYNNIATEGLGLPGIYKEAITGTQTGNVTVVSYTPPATAGRYRLNMVITSTSGTNTGTVQAACSYVNSQGTTLTNNVIPIISTGATAFAATGTGASKEHRMATVEISINNSATAITLQVITTGTVNYTAAGCIEQLS